MADDYSLEDHRGFFTLQEGEEIVESIKPMPRLLTFFFLRGAGPLLILAFIVAVFLSMISFSAAVMAGSSTRPNFVGPITLLVVTLLGFVVAFVRASLKYSKEFYWITNKRLVIKRGLIGYRIISIPLERISDVIVSRSLLERILGFSSLYIQSLAGQFSYGPYGAEGRLLAVPNPIELQKKIFELVREKRKAEHLTM